MIIDHINTIIARVKPGEENLIKSQPINEEAESEIVKLLCGRFSSAWNKYFKEEQEIWRGVKSSYDYGNIVVMTPGTRISQNVNNLYTRLMSEILPEWKEYPKRSNSFICTNSDALSSFYGDSYLVLPENGAKIGICPKADIWDSFRLTLNHTSIPDFVAGMKEILSIATKKSENKINEILINGTTEEIIKAFDKTTKYVHTSAGLFYCISADYELFNEFDSNKKLTLLEYVQKKLDPVKNNFSLTTIEQYKLPSDSKRELWTDATCLMVKEETVPLLRRIMGGFSSCSKK